MLGHRRRDRGVEATIQSAEFLGGGRKVLCNGDFRDGLADIAVIVHDLRHVEPQCPQLTPVLMNAWSMNTTLRAELSVRSSEPHITAVLLEHGGRVSVMRRMPLSSAEWTGPSGARLIATTSGSAAAWDTTRWAVIRRSLR